jgi:hypothetical protein
MGIASPHLKLFFGSNAQKRINSRLNPPERLCRAEHQEDQQAPIPQAGVWLMPPAVGRAFQGAAHGVVPQIAISTKPNNTITVLTAADSTNQNSDLLISHPPRRYAVKDTLRGKF